MTTIPLQPVDSVTVTCLIDNVSDMLLTPEGPAKRPVLGDPVTPRVAAATRTEKEPDDYRPAPRCALRFIYDSQTG